MNTRKLGELGGFMAMASADADKYRAEIVKVMSGTQPDVVFNGTIDHACIVIEEAFLSAERTMRILTSKLDCACYTREGVVAAMREFIRRPGVRLEILVEDVSDVEPIAKHVFLSEAVKLAPDRVFVFHVPPELVQSYAYNFLVVDEKAYRFEEDRRVPVAVVAGGASAKSGVSNLLKVFESIKIESKPVNTRELLAA